MNMESAPGAVQCSYSTQEASFGVIISSDLLYRYAWAVLYLMLIIPLLIGGLISVVILSWILQVSTRIICGDAIAFGDAFKVALVGVFVGIGVSFIPLAEGAQGYVIGTLISFAVWTLAIFIMVGLSFVQSLLVAAVLKVLHLVLSLIAMAILTSMQGPG
jgi:hypothetical protein